jgi:hypothetical membrane protein
MNNLIQFLSLPLDDVVPTPVAAQPPGTEKVATLLGWGKWIGLAMCVAGLIVAGAMMAIQSRRGEGGEHVGTIGKVLAAVILIGAAGAIVGFLTT